MLDAGGKQQYGIDHPRSGELVAIADPDAWFTYYYWDDDERAPDFARTVEIHRKPGYDPVELFLDPAIRIPALTVGWKLARRKLGFRTLLDVIPLDASLVKGSHGRRAGPGDLDAPVFITRRQDLLALDQPAIDAGARRDPGASARVTARRIEPDLITATESDDRCRASGLDESGRILTTARLPNHEPEPAPHVAIGDRGRCCRACVAVFAGPSRARRSVAHRLRQRDRPQRPSVDNLVPSDLEIKEGGKLVTIESAGRATEPLQIDLIVDDNGTGLFRAPLARFVQRMEGRAVMALRSVVGQTMKLVEFTPNVDALMRGIATLNARPGNARWRSAARRHLRGGDRAPQGARRGGRSSSRSRSAARSTAP